MLDTLTRTHDSHLFVLNRLNHKTVLHKWDEEFPRKEKVYQIRNQHAFGGVSLHILCAYPCIFFLLIVFVLALLIAISIPFTVCFINWNSYSFFIHFISIWKLCSWLKWHAHNMHHFTRWCDLMKIYDRYVSWSLRQCLGRRIKDEST